MWMESACWPKGLLMRGSCCYYWLDYYVNWVGSPAGKEKKSAAKLKTQKSATENAHSTKVNCYWLCTST